MERKLQERMVGAGVLVIALVIVGPMLLDSRSGSDVANVVPGQRSDELRTHTFRLDEPPVDTVATPSAAPPPTMPASTPAPVMPAAGEPSGLAASAQQPGSAETSARARDAPGDASPARTPVSAPSALAGDWLVQVGTFGQKNNANRLAAGLKERGFAAFVSPATRGGKTLYRVRVGPPGSREDAAGVASRLAAAGHTGQIVTQ
jgi:DedD protein